jgi:FlaA1/EpsC-like NDP-sugar epimerase
MNVHEITSFHWAKDRMSVTLSRKLMLLFLDTVAIAAAMWLAVLMHRGMVYQPGLWVILVLALVTKVTVFGLLGVYRISLSYLGLHDAAQIVMAVGFGSLIFGGASALRWMLGTSSLDLPMLVSDFLLTLVFIGGIRAMRRTYHQLLRRRPMASVRRTLIVGAGSAGELILRAIYQEKTPEYLPLGFIDDDPAKLGMTIHGVPVLGTRYDIPRLVRDQDIRELLISIPSAPASTLKSIIELGRQAGLKRIRALPGVHNLIDGKVTVSDLRDIQVEDLLGRAPVRIETRQIESYINNKVVLVTGGAGSIGSELCQQIASFRPETLVVIDQDETGLFHLRQDLLRRHPILNLAVVVGDIQDKVRVDNVFAYFRPQAVFHSAAYKHVSMMEENPAEAVRNNVFGTRTVGEAACRYGAEKFVLISTDKAVNPTCVMGATKRLAEMVVRDLNERDGCRFVAVRFGNVLGSRGSVVPIFREQIQRGGPVTVTHPDMRRYFMIPSEAALLVLQAGAIGDGGEVFVLDMGAPVSVLELAREMIRLAGLEPDKDIRIVFTQPYPGEKLFEDILTAEEGTVASKHERIYIARTNGEGHRDRPLDESLDRLQAAIGQDKPATILKALAEAVPNFNHTNGLFRPGTTAESIMTTTIPDTQVPRSPVHFSSEKGKQWQPTPK